MWAVLKAYEITPFLLQEVSCPEHQIQVGAHGKAPLSLESTSVNNIKTQALQGCSVLGWVLPVGPHYTPLQMTACPVS